MRRWLVMRHLPPPAILCPPFFPAFVCRSVPATTCSSTSLSKPGSAPISDVSGRWALTLSATRLPGCGMVEAGISTSSTVPGETPAGTTMSK